MEGVEWVETRDEGGTYFPIDCQLTSQYAPNFGSNTLDTN